jgi:hypothetical protein
MTKGLTRRQALGTIGALGASAATLRGELLRTVTIGGADVSLARPPKSLVVREKLGLVTAEPVDGQVIHIAEKKLFETRATITPAGDYLLMFPEGAHYGGGREKKNEMVAYRSTDRGKTWTGPTTPVRCDYSLHGFIPLTPRGGKRMYCFGTQPIADLREGSENCPIGYRWSDDDGRTWTDATLIRPVNDPDFKGMSVMRMAETDTGAWILGSHAAEWGIKPLRTRQFLLRSADRGKTWELLPKPRPSGWFVAGFDRMDEARPIALGGGEVYLMARTPEGHLWGSRSKDDGKTWEDPKPTPLVHPDAPPMLFFMPDGKTLAAFHHNRYSGKYDGLSARSEMMKDRSELWVAFSRDGGRTWTEPRFVLANALAPSGENLFYDYQCSYLDAFADGDTMHLFLPHRWKRALHLRVRASALLELPTRKQVRG